jgi:excisionase family DNA binding protein
LITKEDLLDRRYEPVKRALSQVSIGRTKLYRLIREGRIRAVRLDGSTYIDMQSVARMFESLPELRPASPMRVLSAADIGLPDEPEALHRAALGGGA